jgi:hypothetical protein
MWKVIPQRTGVFIWKKSLLPRIHVSLSGETESTIRKKNKLIHDVSERISSMSYSTT